MVATGIGRDPLGQALAVPATPAGRGPAGFDPSRVELRLVAVLDSLRVEALAKCALLLSTMAGEGIAIEGHDDSADLYSEVIMALGIEDADDTDIMADEVRMHPAAATIVDRVADWLLSQSDRGADIALGKDKGTTARAAFGGGSLALKRAADAISEAIAMEARQGKDAQQASSPDDSADPQGIVR